MASYDRNFNQMQEEALTRLREMQRRSRTAVNQPHPQNPTPPPQPEHQHREHEQHHRENNGQPVQNRPPQDIIKSILGDVKIDSEKALILLMLFVLYKNKADMKLLLALGYLLI